ncbi:MAG: hypothetical protein ABWX85_05020 [Arthrobacter sp.]
MMKPELPAANDPRVDAFIAALPEWQQPVCREVRALVHAADELSSAAERVQPYWLTPD